MAHLYFHVLPRHLLQYFYSKYMCTEANIQFTYILGPILDLHVNSNISAVELCSYAARNGYIRLLKHIAPNINCDLWLKDVTRGAVDFGQLEILSWIIDISPFSSNDYCCAIAAENGDLKLLQWLKNNKVGWDGSTCAQAAKGNHLEIIKWARANGAPWDWRTCAAAVANNNLELLKWVIAHGAPFDICDIDQNAVPLRIVEYINTLRN